MNISAAQTELEARSIPEPNSGCWIWLGGTGNNYGKIRFGKEVYPAHRLSWAIANGPIPPGMQICHRCDNPAYINPDHLFAGTQKDNMQDCIKKGRKRYGGGGVKKSQDRKKRLQKMPVAMTWVADRVKMLG